MYISTSASTNAFSLRWERSKRLGWKRPSRSFGMRSSMVPIRVSNRLRLLPLRQPRRSQRPAPKKRSNSCCRAACITCARIERSASDGCHSELEKSAGSVK
jgi:hypothetical protein